MSTRISDHLAGSEVAITVERKLPSGTRPMAFREAVGRVGGCCGDMLIRTVLPRPHRIELRCLDIAVGHYWPTGVSHERACADLEKKCGLALCQKEVALADRVVYNGGNQPPDRRVAVAMSPLVCPRCSARMFFSFRNTGRSEMTQLSVCAYRQSPWLSPAVHLLGALPARA